jgi:hypothetical protein
MIQLGIAIPAFGLKLDVGHAPMWLGLGAALASATDKFRLAFFNTYHINGIDLARNTIVYDALQAGCDWVLMLDADTFHATGGAGGGANDADAIADAGIDLLQMIRDADRGQYAVDGQLTPIPLPAGTSGVALVGAPVRGRGVGRAGYCVHRLGAGGQAAGELPEDELLGRVQAVARIGGACIAVNCGWLRNHWAQAPWFEMVHDYSAGRPRNARGEDYSICDGIYARGGAVVCDGRFAPAHVDRRKLVGE